MLRVMNLKFRILLIFVKISVVGRVKNRVFLLYLIMFLYFNLEVGYMDIYYIIFFILLYILYMIGIKVKFINKEFRKFYFFYRYCFLRVMLVFFVFFMLLKWI